MISQSFANFFTKLATDIGLVPYDTDPMSVAERVTHKSSSFCLVYMPEPLNRIRIILAYSTVICLFSLLEYKRYKHLLRFLPHRPYA